MTLNIDKVLAENARVMRSISDHPLNPKRVEEAVFQPNQLVRHFPLSDLDDTTLDITPGDIVIINRFDRAIQHEFNHTWAYELLDRYPYSESMYSTVELCLMCRAPVFPSQLWCSTCDPHLPQDRADDSTLYLYLYSSTDPLPEYIPQPNTHISHSYDNPFDPTSDENGAFTYK